MPLLSRSATILLSPHSTWSLTNGSSGRSTAPISTLGYRCEGRGVWGGGGGVHIFELK